MNFQNFLIFTFLLLSSVGFGQNTDLFDKIEQIGIAYTKALKDGNIESMKNSKPPKNTWTYSRLLEYKQVLNKENTLKYGSFIQLGINTNKFSYNFFAIDYKKEEQPYYFVAIVSFAIKNNEPSIDNAFLFTEKESLDDWWMNTVSFYKDIKEGKPSDIPEKYIFPVCPPPPHNYLKE